MWAESERFSHEFTEEMRVLAPLPNLKRIRIIVNMLESLYFGFYKNNVEYDSIRGNMEMIEAAFRRHRGDVIVTFWWV